MQETRLTFLAAAAEARSVLVLADVEERWDNPSAAYYASIGSETPALSGMALSTALLVDVAELRHGEVAVLRALARRERDSVEALRVL